MDDGVDDTAVGVRAVPVTTTWTAALFMIGSSCFALASVPAVAEVVPSRVIGATYFVGSIFFTSAALLVAATTWRDDRSGARPTPVLRDGNWWAAMIQLVGTFWFNINTFDALDGTLTTHEENLRVWTPDFLGSICFLVASYLALYVVCRRPWCWQPQDTEWQIAALNLLGSVFFMLAAFAAFTLPSTDDLLDASLANSGTLFGALCFFWGARLLLRPEPATSNPA